MSDQVIVVGGGLAGLSAAHTVLERGARVIVLDKNPFLGGNSTKATSGINGALTKTQISQGVPDSVEKFYEDTALSARDLLRPGLVKVLTGKSAPAVEWLQEKFGLDLSLLSRLGGHSFPRTHRGKERFPGMTITYALMEKLEDLAKSSPDRVRIVKKAKVTRLLRDMKEKFVELKSKKMERCSKNKDLSSWQQVDTPPISQKEVSFNNTDPISSISPQQMEITVLVTVSRWFVNLEETPSISKKFKFIPLVW